MAPAIRLDAARSAPAQLLVEGHTYKSAAFELGVSINTIAFHVLNIYRKPQVHSKSEAVARALREYLLG